MEGSLSYTSPSGAGKGQRSLLSDPGGKHLKEVTCKDESERPKLPTKKIETQTFHKVWLIECKFTIKNR